MSLPLILAAEFRRLAAHRARVDEFGLCSYPVSQYWPVSEPGGRI
jgi:hypothetical protein